MTQDELVAATEKSFSVTTPNDAGRRNPNGERRMGFYPRSIFGCLLLVMFFLALCFAKPLYDLVRFALQNELSSHLPAIPFISLYFVWLNKRSRIGVSKPFRRLALFPLAAGLSALAGYWTLAGPALPQNDYLALTIFAFVALVWASCLLILGRDTVRSAAFPIAFLLLMVPMPMFLQDAIEVFFQHTSAVAAWLMLKATGTLVFRDGLEFRVPGMTMVVAQECSGIRSSLVLFITSLVAGHLFLRSPWKKAVLVCAVIPLGILRNGFRILTIAQLCIHVNPEMINSPIHRRGGPIFFLLFLIPFFLMLYFLRRSEFRKTSQRNS